MEIEVDEDLLRMVATGGQMDYGLWPALSQGIIARLDKIAHNAFPIPNLPPLPQHINSPEPLRLLSPLPSSANDPPSSQPSSQDADKENSQPSHPTESPTASAADKNDATPKPLAPGALPTQIEAMLVEINSVLSSFPKYPPHTIQRLAELVLEPRRHYRHLASYLHAVDRVVHVTSGANIYPLPPAIPDMSAMTLLSNGSPLNGGQQQQLDPAEAVSWGNSTNSVASTVGTDEALGGALLTPIPWLTRRPSPGSASPSSSNGGGPAEIRTESTETIDGPNGVGSIETVSVSVNGIPSMGASHLAATRGITQGELLRQEQEHGVVPANQPLRPTEEARHVAALRASGGGDNSPRSGAGSPEKQETTAAEDENETPHARGPEEIGVDDLGPQSVTTSFVGGPGVEMQGIDVEAAVGRKATTPPLDEEKEVKKEGEEEGEEEETPTTAEEIGAADDAASETSITSHPKRDASEDLLGLTSKKIKEREGDVATAGEATDAAADDTEGVEEGEKKTEAAKPNKDAADEGLQKSEDAKVAEEVTAIKTEETAAAAEKVKAESSGQEV